METSELPSVTGILTAKELRLLSFVKPSPDREIAMLYEEGSSREPKSETMAIRHLMLGSNSVVPMHVHDKKDKFYCVLAAGTGTFVVTMQINDHWEAHSLKAGGRAFVPHGCPHSVKYLSENTENCLVLVISSPKDDKDVRWEYQTNELIKNEHLVPAKQK